MAPGFSLSGAYGPQGERRNRRKQSAGGRGAARRGPRLLGRLLFRELLEEGPAAGGAGRCETGGAGRRRGAGGVFRRPAPHRVVIRDVNGRLVVFAPGADIRTVLCGAAAEEGGRE